MDLEGMGSLAADARRRAVSLYHRVLYLVQEKGGPMIGGLLAFLITPLGRWAAIAAMVLAAWFGFARHYEKKGMSRVTAQIEKKVAENEKKAAAVRGSVQSLPVDRLRDKWTRN